MPQADNETAEVQYPLHPSLTIALRIEYQGHHHTIRLPAVTKEEGIKELKSMAMSAEDGFLADTIEWLFNDVWVDREDS